MIDLKKGTLYSIAIHLSLAGLFSSIIIKSRPQLPEFVEIVLPAAASITEPFVAEKAAPEKISLPEVKHQEPELKIFEPKEIAKEVPEEIAPKKYTPSAGENFDNQAYTITGELSTRKVIHKRIPKYPKGYTVVVKVSIQLFVLPSGEIERMKLTKKGGTPFDKLTQDALREWRFEPLPPKAPQVTAGGEITFVYKLR